MSWPNRQVRQDGWGKDMEVAVVQTASKDQWSDDEMAARKAVQARVHHPQQQEQTAIEIEFVETQTHETRKASSNWRRLSNRAKHFQEATKSGRKASDETSEIATPPKQTYQQSVEIEPEEHQQVEVELLGPEQSPANQQKSKAPKEPTKVSIDEDYASFTAMEKQIFIKLINAGMPPTKASQRVIRIRNRRLDEPFTSPNIDVREGSSKSTSDTASERPNVTEMASYDTFTRTRRPGAAKSRLAKHKQHEIQAAQQLDWRRSIQVDARTNNPAVEPEWFPGQHEKIKIDLGKTKMRSGESLPGDAKKRQEANGIPVVIPFPDEWAKEREAMFQGRSGQDSAEEKRIVSHENVPAHHVEGGFSLDKSTNKNVPNEFSSKWKPYRYVMFPRKGAEEVDSLPEGTRKIPVRSTETSFTLARIASIPAVRLLLRCHYCCRTLFHRRLFKSISYGQLILLLPLIFFTVGCLYFTFPHPNTAQSGNYAFFAVFYAFVVSFKCANPLRLIGLSWDQLVHTHHMASLVAILLGISHSYVAYTGHDYIPCQEYFSEQQLAIGIPLCRNTTDPHRFLYELRLEDNPRFRHSIIGDPDLWKFLWDGGRNISGSYLMVYLLGLVLTSSFRSVLRRGCFDLWLLSHIAFAGAVVAYSGKHRVGLFMVVIFWWGFDGILRYGVGTCITLPKTARLRLVSTSKDNTVVELQLDRKFHYTAGQYVRIAVLETGQAIMFHPMTISSAPYQPNVTIHFRPYGGWTRQVARMGKNRDCNVHVLLEGPYGSLSMNLFEDPSRYPMIVLIAGGIGVTPMSSLARQLLYEHAKGSKRKEIRVAWSIRDINLFESLPLLDDHVSSCTATEQQNTEPIAEDHVTQSESFDTDDDSADIFKAHIFVTGSSIVKQDGTNRRLLQNAEMSSFCSSLDDHRMKPDFSRIISKAGTDDNIELHLSESGKHLVSSHIQESDKKQRQASVRETISNYYSEDSRFSFYPGRPDVEAFLRETASTTERIRDTDDQRIAVIACGPLALVKAAREACVQLSRNGPVALDFHEEKFLL